MVRERLRSSRWVIAAGAMAGIVLGIIALTGSPSSGPAAAPQPPAKLLFATDFTKGLDSSIASFPIKIHPERVSVVDDPVLGSARKVLEFKVFNEDTGPTENPRAQLETPYDFDEGEDRYFGVSYNFASDFPTLLPQLGWVVVGSMAYGPPFGGAGAITLKVQNNVEGGGAELRWQRNKSYGFDIPWVGPKIADVRGRWLDIVARVKLDRDPAVGFVELWMNTGKGWAQQKLSGRHRLYMKTIDYTNSGGPNNSRLQLYYRADTPGPLTMHHAQMRIASAGRGAFDLVAPDSYR